MANVHNTGHMSSKILASVVNLIDVSISRATWKGPEIGQIAQLREIFSEATEAAAAAEKKIAEEIESKKTSTEDKTENKK